jgi:hypothetical protein
LTVAANLPTLSFPTVPLGVGQTFSTDSSKSKGLISLPPESEKQRGAAGPSGDCSTPQNCLDSLNWLQGISWQQRLVDSFAGWNAYAVAAGQGVTSAAAYYQQLAVAQAGVPAKPSDQIPMGFACVDEVKAEANWILSAKGSASPRSGTSSCMATVPIPDINLPVLFANIAAWQSLINFLHNQIASNPTQFAVATNPSVQTGVNDASTLTTRLTSLDMSANIISGAAGSALRTQVAALLPFYDFDENLSWATITVPCHPYDVDGQFHTLTLIASSRLPTTTLGNPVAYLNSSQTVATIDCPGAVAISAGGGWSTIPLVSYQAVATNAALAKNPTYIIGQSHQNSQVYAAALAHYFLFPFGNTQAAVFATGGLGSSTTTFSAYYGLSIGIGRKFFVNALLGNGSVTTLGQGYAVGEPIPAGFTIPTNTARLTKISYGISIGTPPF